jgi:hypothetical protein
MAFRESRKDGTRISGSAAFLVGSLVQQINNPPLQTCSPDYLALNRSSLGGPRPFTGEKLSVATALVEEQLKAYTQPLEYSNFCD